jgi:hypothetical protein
MINQIGEVVAAGFSAGIITGTVVFLLNWVMSSAMNILNLLRKGD